MWATAFVTICLLVALGFVLFARTIERLMLRWYQAEVARIEIVQRPDEKIVTYPMA